MYQTIEQTIEIDENQEREKIQAEVDKKFSDYEQMTLWRCMNDKEDPELHKDLSPIVRKHISTVVPVELYRGVSGFEISELLLDVGDTFTTERVKSFSSDFSTARQFAGAYCYGTHTILSIRNCPLAFNYQEHMLQMVLGAPDSEYMNKSFDERMDQLDMIESEQEFMFPIGTTFRVLSIDDLSHDPRSRNYTIYHLELVSI